MYDNALLALPWLRWRVVSQFGAHRDVYVQINLDCIQLLHVKSSYCMQIPFQEDYVDIALMCMWLLTNTKPD